MARSELKIVKGDYKRHICKLLGHNKVESFAHPSVFWYCKRCEMRYYLRVWGG